MTAIYPQKAADVILFGVYFIIGKIAIRFILFYLLE